ncbi:hypothetical protein I6N95_26355 [Vagococcus sp. BWB3-3]|uniref:Uncharacterized protein n=1 Tax=Vagococcus allomyrinae TaxID=2794353 RepID=A0A940PH53_9ENTE|nr:hypothetical protein [Vagococcus allomyrinae]MBP1044537.1 hypothetical protein [Vagococcus allomyrinae]
MKDGIPQRMNVFLEYGVILISENFFEEVSILGGKLVPLFYKAVSLEQEC